MAETVTVTHTVGTPGWPGSRRGGARAWALSALAGTLLGQRLRSNLALLWRLRALWRSGLAGLDPKTARLALCLDERVTLAGLAVEITLDDLRFTLKFVRATDGTDRLPPAFDGGRWLVAAVAAGSRPAFARLAAALPGVRPGTVIAIALSAEQSDAPPAARDGFGARMELRIGAEPQWITLLAEQAVTAAAAPATARAARRGTATPAARRPATGPAKKSATPRRTAAAPRAAARGRTAR